MRSYDARCIMCGTVNRGLFLDETNGLFECEKCSSINLVMLDDEAMENFRKRGGRR